MPPHLRKRYVSSSVEQSLKFSPVVGLLGQRQVGKTTLLESLSNSYATFDRERDLLEAEQSPEFFLENRKAPFGVDESQLCPRLFPAIKEAVRLKKAPGQFLLSGSVRFTSRQMIRESLTGRIVNHEVLPFTLREAHQLPRPQLLTQIMKVQKEKDLERLMESSVQTRKHFDDYLQTGGLPGICFFREEGIRNRKFEAQVDTLLNRDLQLVIKSTLPYSSLRALLTYLAVHQGEVLELKAAGEASQISTVTLKRILFAFESLFLIRQITAIGSEKKPSYFLEDQGMATWLRSAANVRSDTVRSILGGIYANLRQEFFYDFDRKGSIHHYRTRHGVAVPLVFRWAEGCLGVIHCLEKTPAPKTLGSAQAFLKKNPGARVVIAVTGDHSSLPILPVLRTPELFFMPYYGLG
jgi:uncharacterized protein